MFLKQITVSHCVDYVVKAMENVVYMLRMTGERPV